MPRWPSLELRERDEALQAGPSDDGVTSDRHPRMRARRGETHHAEVEPAADTTTLKHPLTGQSLSQAGRLPRQLSLIHI